MIYGLLCAEVISDKLLMSRSMAVSSGYARRMSATSLSDTIKASTIPSTVIFGRSATLFAPLKTESGHSSRASSVQTESAAVPMILPFRSSTVRHSPRRCAISTVPISWVSRTAARRTKTITASAMKIFFSFPVMLFSPFHLSPGEPFAKHLTGISKKLSGTCCR